MSATGRLLALSVDRGGEPRRTALRARLVAFLSVFGEPVDEAVSTADLLRRLDAVLAVGETDRIWLALAVLTGSLPEDAVVESTARTARLDGPLAALAPRLLRSHRRPGSGESWPLVRVVSGAVLVDVHDAAQAEGGYEVTRRLVAGWERAHAPVLVGWAPSRDALRVLSGQERARVLGEPPAGAGAPTDAAEVLVPWHCTYLLPESVTAPWRASRLLAMLRRSGTTGRIVGFGCSPLSSAPGELSGGFATMLAASAWADRLAATSEAAAGEYRGWRTMLAGTGLRGPEVAALPVADEPSWLPPSAAALTRVTNELDTAGRSLVLCVGHHRSDRNHLTVLVAAEQLWQEGRSFCLAFVGEDAGDRRFAAEAERLIALGRPLRVLAALPEELLWAAYAAARCTVFPSLNEGLVPPVAASLAAGTPVITSGHGCMREVLDGGGGGLLVDPRDDDDVTVALRSLLVDDELHHRLTAQARARPVRTWDHYAEQVWDYLVTPA